MTQKIPLFIFLLAVLKVVASQYGCNVNEYPTQEVNPCNSCEIRSWCPQPYGPGCDCFPGYFRNSQGICVPPEACEGPYDYPSGRGYRPPPQPPRPPPRCRGPFEQYTECGSACPETCENRRGVACAAVCVPGCFCSPGYVRNKQGTCVRPDQCPKVLPYRPNQCGPNEQFLSCGSACPATCDTLRSGGACTEQCIPGCFCTKGYVRQNGRCVRESECGAGPIYPRNNFPPPTYRPAYRPAYRPTYRPPVNPYPPPATKPPVLPPPPPPTGCPNGNQCPSQPSNGKGCPSRNLCNRFCKSAGFAVGFCVGSGFLRCNCMG